MSELVCQDLATKAELQELRDQLNEVLGTKEDGSKVDMFVKDQGTNLIGGAIGLTLLGMAKSNAPKAITDILINAKGQGTIVEQLANGTAKISGFNFATKVTNPLEDLTKVSAKVGDNAKTAKVAAKGAAASGAALAVLANLVSIGASLALNIATVKVFDQRIDAIEKGQQMQLNAMNQSMLNLYEKNQGNIAKVNQEIARTNQEVAENKQANAIIQSEVREANRNNAKLDTDLKKAGVAITDLNKQNQELVDLINNSNIENEEAVAALTLQATSIQDNLDRAQNIIAQQQQTIKEQETRIIELEERQEKLEEQYEALSIGYIHLRDDFNKLKQALGLDEPTSLLDPDKEVARVATYVKAPEKAATGGGEASPSSVKANVDQQNRMLALTKNFSGADIDIPEITEEDVRLATTTFATTFDALMDNFDNGTMTPEQLEDLRSGIVTGTTTNLNNLFATTFIPRLDDISTQASDRRQIANTRAGICESLNGGSCPTTPSNPNPTQGLQGMQNNLSNQSNGLRDLLGLADLQQGQTILGYVRDTNNVVNDAKFGLKKVQEFASTAWKAAQGDKIMSGITTALTVHNAMMLSANLGQTIAEAGNVTLSAIGIKDEEGNPFDIGAIVQGKTTEILTNFLGEQNYALVTQRIAKANRIYQASVNVLDTTSALFDSARTISELTASNTGKIGNALIEAGAVYEDAYDEMIEKVNPQNAAQRKLERFREGLEAIEEGVSAVSTISSEIVETRENFAQLKEEKEAWQTEVNTAIEEQVTEKQQAKEEAQVAADIDDISFDPAIPDETST